MRQFVDKLHTPYERALQLVVRRHLRGRAARTAKRLEAALPKAKGIEQVVTKADLGLSWLLEILASYDEMILFKTATRPVITKMVRESVARALRQAGAAGETVSPEWIDNKVKTIVEDMAGNMEQGTKDMVKSIIEQGLDRGATIGELQDYLMQGVAFSPERALRVARTETTKSISAAKRGTYDQLADKGIEMELVWMAAPGARDAHELLDNAPPIQPGETFVIPSGEFAGESADHPGGFGRAALDINCRCTIVSRIKN
jgi:hypothetical protein